MFASNLLCRSLLFGLALTICIGSRQTDAQEEAPTADEIAAEVTGDTQEGEKGSVQVADEVQVDPINSDQRIETRLQEIMEATGWFTNPSVTVDRGVAFLSGTSDTKSHRDWAESTAIKTSDVVAVVNRLKVAELPLWNFAPAM
ncbi:MAG: BON domain-containing protein, partial [Rhodopirellula sp. JB055]|uniref:BON domain-containing protein n=1 Tax=Rhodopirellula sp. JB055 TaxID=3342846 RepID=UPI003709FF08